MYKIMLITIYPPPIIRRFFHIFAEHNYFAEQTPMPAQEKQKKQDIQ